MQISDDTITFDTIKRVKIVGRVKRQDVVTLHMKVWLVISHCICKRGHHSNITDDPCIRKLPTKFITHMRRYSPPYWGFQQFEVIRIVAVERLGRVPKLQHLYSALFYKSVLSHRNWTAKTGDANEDFAEAAVAHLAVICMRDIIPNVAFRSKAISHSTLFRQRKVT